MIVVDESLAHDLVINAIADWYRGRVVSILSLRPATHIEDETIPTLLHNALKPTFVTINVDDFWRKAALIASTVSSPYNSYRTRHVHCRYYFVVSCACQNFVPKQHGWAR